MVEYAMSTVPPWVLQFIIGALIGWIVAGYWKEDER